MDLYLDDERVEPLGWLRVTTAENCIRILQDYAGCITALSLDHDLDACVDTRRGHAEPGPLTGYDVAVWLENQAADGNWKVVPAAINCHSDNPDGRKRILQAIDSIARMRERRVL